jgi:phage FluMu gp28-like protein
LLDGYDKDLHGSLFLGFDVARFRDASVIFIFGQNNSGKKRAVAEIEMINTKFRIQRENVRQIYNRLPIVRGVMDRTGLGLQLCEELQEEYGETRLEGMDFTPASKELLAVNFKKGLENTEFLLHNDKKYRRQVHSIKRMAGYGGIFRYDSQRDEDGHADSFWASTLANYAVIGSDNVKPNFWDQRAMKKQAGVIQLNTTVDNQPSNSAGTSLTPTKRGKSMQSVLRGINRANS